MATDMAEIKKRVDDLNKRHTSATRKRDELSGQLEAKKAELVALAKEIKEAGYDPKKIKEEKERVEQDLLDALSRCETEITEVESALAAFDKK